ncbi:TMEM165/GDT1 family protein [Marinobacterium arenosum]|uniref:TMEM165/GDT1 family protein n=1 Tax=Marinobacterium arenosum TaxID=2862496 RepID=UPI001C9615FF|nr:TMEM165/GDT1 family protein [Marinobacterium arenosum]MBY4676623.1 TMEM165/GDT1 family protein [Marinobacterium arenosum]
MDELSSILKTYALVVGAEFGDKSQLVCMALAARYRALPVVSGAVSAFALLNLLAVTVGAVVALWLPQWLVMLAVASLFTLFGVLALRGEEEDDDEEDTRVGRYLFWSVFGLIFMAELGDKTQLAITGLGGVEPPAAVWLGGTLALATTSIAGVWAGRMLLQRFPVGLIHKVGGGLFLLFAALVWWQLAERLMG